MNKQISTGAGIVVILIATVLFSLGLWKASKKLNQLQSNAQNAQQKLSQIPSKNKAKQNCVQPSYDYSKYEGGPVYKNTNYGFQLTLPKGWEDYKAVEKKRGQISVVSFQLPVDSGSKELSDAFAINIRTTDQWEKDVKKHYLSVAGPGGPNNSSILQVSSKYVFESQFLFTVEYDSKYELENINLNDFMRDNFKLL
jgi:hypothetical protein